MLDTMKLQEIAFQIASIQEVIFADSCKYKGKWENDKYAESYCICQFKIVYRAGYMSSEITPPPPPRLVQEVDL